ncbi:unnamed protein product [Urochloa humidicola]
MASAEAGHTDIPVDLLEEILLRLDDVADLARCSTACSSFRGIIADGRFLRRFRSLHQPPVAGVLVDSDGGAGGFSFHPAEPPRRAQAASALARAADFSYPFLPDPDPAKCWCVHDVRDGRLLLLLRDLKRWFAFEYLVVYDPLHRRQVKVPPIPLNLLTAARPRSLQWQQFHPFLVPAAVKEENKDDDDLSFRVMCNAVYSEDKVETFVYSSVTGGWRSVASFRISSCSAPMGIPSLLQRHYARGCFYWTYDLGGVMVMLDLREMKFSVVNLPPGSEQRGKVIVETMESRVACLLIHGENMLDLYSMAWPQDNGGVGVIDWRHDNVIPLSDDYRWSFAYDALAVEGYALLLGFPREKCQAWKDCPEKSTNTHCFTVELKILLVEQLCVLKSGAYPNFLYASFPPPFAPPSI